MAKFFDKMMDMMNLNDYEEETEINSNEIDTYENISSRQFKSYSGGKEYSANNVVNFQTSVSMEVVVIQPTTYEEALDICDHIKSKKPVVINLEGIEHALAQRIMDFTSGSCYSLNGDLQKVTNNIFIIAPENVDIAGEFEEELKSNGIILPWKNE